MKISKKSQKLRRRRWPVVLAVVLAAVVILTAVLTAIIQQNSSNSTDETADDFPLTITDAAVEPADKRDWAAINAKVAEIDQMLQNYDEKLSVGFYDFDADYTYTYNADAEYYEASLVKVVAAMYAYENMDVTDNVRSLVNRAISVSDNNAYQSLVNLIKPKNLKQYGESIGLEDFLQTDDLSYGNTTIADQITTFKHLWQVVNNNARGTELKADFIGSSSCYLTAADGVDIMCKYGQYGQNFHNAGIVLAEHPYIVVILTEVNGGNYAEIIRQTSQALSELNQLLYK